MTNVENLRELKFSSSLARLTPPDSSIEPSTTYERGLSFVSSSNKLLRSLKGTFFHFGRKRDIRGRGTG